jgi:hypothetical protein
MSLSRPYLSQGLLVFSDGSRVYGRKLTSIGGASRGALP